MTQGASPARIGPEDLPQETRGASVVHLQQPCRVIPWGRREGIVLGPEGKDQKAIYYITTRAAAIEPLVQKVKKALGDLVKDVRILSTIARTWNSSRGMPSDPTRSERPG